MTYWLFPYNPEKFNLEECLSKQGFVEWHQRNKFKVGDIMYFYATSPYKLITHKMEVVKINIPTEDTVDDSEFMTESYNIKVAPEVPNFRVVPIKRLSTMQLHADEMAKYGLKTGRVSIQKLEGNLLDYIENIASK